MKSKFNKGLIVYIVLLSLFILNATIAVVNMKGDLYGDEYVFLRLTNQLPTYSTSANWILKDKPNLVSSLISEEKYNNAYTEKVWIHPPLANYILYPINKLIDLSKPNIARLIPLILMIITAILISDIIRRKYELLFAGLSFLPFILSNHLLGDSMYLYNDCFMWLFFGISLWLAFVKPQSKWIWITLIAIVLSKEIGILLIPAIAIYKKEWKYLLPILALIPWLVWIAVANNDIFYIIKHWIGLSNGSNLLNFFNFGFVYGLYAFVILTITGFIISIKQKEWSWLYLYIICIIYGMGWGYISYQLLSIEFAGMFMVAIGFKYIWDSYIKNKKEKHND